MKLVTTFAHGMLDYAVGLALLIGWPLFGLGSEDRIDVLVPQAIGLALLTVAMLTRYELGALRVLAMPVHLVLDAVAGALLALSPWIFAFAHASAFWTAHVLAGTVLLVLALVTDPLERHAHA